jgi:hypothetical protein
MSAEQIRLHTQEVIRQNTLRGETIDTLDDAIQLLSNLGRTDLADQIHDVLLQVDSFMIKNQDINTAVVLELFASRMQVSA